MPRVRALGSAARKADETRKLDELADRVVQDALALYKSRSGKTDEAVAQELGWERSKIKRMRADPRRVRLQDVLSLLRLTGANAEEWGRIIGGPA